MKTVTIAGHLLEYNTHEDLVKQALQYNVRIGSGVRIGADVRIGCDVYIGSDVIIGFGVRIGAGVRIGSNGYIDPGVRGVVMKVTSFSRIYKYDSAIIETKHPIYIRMGCFTRTVNEWREDFWNNDREFLKGSEEGARRLLAFNIKMDVLGLPRLEG